MIDFIDWVLTEEAAAGVKELQHYVKQDGTVDLFHYSPMGYSPPKEITLNPSRFGERSYTFREKQQAPQPRTFFYLDPRDKEGMISGSLYRTEHPGARIYDLTVDDQGMWGKAKNIYGIFQSDILIDNLKALEGFDGAYYVANRIPMVILFVSKKAQLANPLAPEQGRA